MTASISFGIAEIHVIIELKAKIIQVETRSVILLVYELA